MAITFGSYGDYSSGVKGVALDKAFATATLPANPISFLAGVATTVLSFRAMSPRPGTGANDGVYLVALICSLGTGFITVPATGIASSIILAKKNLKVQGHDLSWKKFMGELCLRTINSFIAQVQRT